MVFVLETGDEVEIFFWINAEESSFVVDASSFDVNSGDVFVPELKTDFELEIVHWENR